MDELTTTVLEEAADHFKSARTNILIGASLLYQIASERLWEAKYAKFGDYLEGECQISESYASKLIKSYKHYVVDGGLSPRNLEDTDLEKLYLAISLTGTPVQQAIKAETLTRSEIKAELSEKDGVECQHLQTLTICASCHARV